MLHLKAFENAQGLYWYRQTELGNRVSRVHTAAESGSEEQRKLCSSVYKEKPCLFDFIVGRLVFDLTSWKKQI